MEWTFQALTYLFSTKGINSHLTDMPSQLLVESQTCVGPNRARTMFVKSVDSMASTTYCMYFSDNQWQFHELLAWQEQARSVQEDFNRRSSSSDVTFMPGILPLEAPGTSNIVALNDQSLCTILWAGDAGINSGYLFVSMSIRVLLVLQKNPVGNHESGNNFN